MFVLPLAFVFVLCLGDGKSDRLSFPGKTLEGLVSWFPSKFTEDVVHFFFLILLLTFPTAPVVSCLSPLVSKRIHSQNRDISVTQWGDRSYWRLLSVPMSLVLGRLCLVRTLVSVAVGDHPFSVECAEGVAICRCSFGRSAFLRLVKQERPVTR